jgi:guanylate kinase
MNQIFTITGPSCAGKSTLEQHMRHRLGFENVISTTTRPMREGDVDGVAYHFISEEEFETAANLGSFVEMVEFNGNYYGVSVEEVNRVFATGKPVVIVVEPNGQKQIVDYAKTVGWEVFSIFVTNPPKVIAERFLNRFEGDCSYKADYMIEKLVETYSARLATIMTVEVQWVVEAMEENSPYQMRIGTFGVDDVKPVLAMIKSNMT